VKDMNIICKSIITADCCFVTNG